MSSMKMISMTSEMVNTNPYLDCKVQGLHHYKCRLRYDRRQMSVYFSMGPAHCKEPTPKDVLECLFLDASSVGNSRSFEEWCRDLGYDTDNRKAERTYKVCEKQASKLHRLLGNDYDKIEAQYADR